MVSGLQGRIRLQSLGVDGGGGAEFCRVSGSILPFSGSFVSSGRRRDSVFPLPFSRTLHTSRESEFFSSTFRGRLRSSHRYNCFSCQTWFCLPRGTPCHSANLYVIGQGSALNFCNSTESFCPVDKVLFTIIIEKKYIVLFERLTMDY